MDRLHLFFKLMRRAARKKRHGAQERGGQQEAASSPSHDAIGKVQRQGARVMPRFVVGPDRTQMGYRQA
ncbi:hypothetical protein chiPu_0029908, partial [Chiloscyllium punctatum]|nr:hypothetical protein [Chiloscyllium punctatum]